MNAPSPIPQREYTNAISQQQSNEPVHLNEFEASLAMQLLRSVDERIASAARRIFSNVNVTTTTPHLAESISSTANESIKYSSSTEQYNGSNIDDNFNDSSETFKDISLEKSSIPTKSSKNEDAQASNERLLRRERNRIHARRTRQRKKEHMQSLQQQIDELRDEQVKLKQVINEKSTANILLDMCGSAGDDQNMDDSKGADPEVDKLLKRPAEEIPTVPKANVLPALILPRQGKRGKIPGTEEKKSNDLVTSPMLQAQTGSKDDINYELLAKDRSACTAAELDKIRRERNRMHAKRTRDRKRILMEEMQGIIKKLEGENQKLKEYAGIWSESPTTDSSPTPSQSTTATDPPKLSVEASNSFCTSELAKTASLKEEPQVNGKAISFHQLNNLLAAVTAFEEKETVSGSADIPEDKVANEDECVHVSKRVCLNWTGTVATETDKLNTDIADNR